MKETSQHRDILHQRLVEDLIGPRDEEGLESLPTDVYLTGILWPRQTAMSQEDDDRLATAGGSSDEEVDDESSGITFGVQKPSVAGISFSARSEVVPKISVYCRFATYGQRVGENKSGKKIWFRTPHAIDREIELEPGEQRISLADTDSDADMLNVYLNVRCIETDADGVILATLTLVNRSEPEMDRREVVKATLFQTSIHVEPCKGTILIPKPSKRSSVLYSERNEDEVDVEIDDEKSGELLYRNVMEFAVGHVCSAEWEESVSSDDGTPCANWVGTTWIPSAIVEGVDPEGHKMFAKFRDGRGFNPLSAKALAWASVSDLQLGLEQFCEVYENWIKLQWLRLDDPNDVDPKFRLIGEDHLSRCEKALERMKKTVIELGNDPRLRRAFQLANLAMHVQHSWSKSADGDNLRWRPFQLGFLLLSASSSVNRNHPDREFMDLLWFPTGGGKTEAYLALIACVAIYRRLSEYPSDQTGMCAVMRYTLRLLTTQQFSRSSAMILALEAIRTGRVPLPNGLPILGTQPFSIGLWVGGQATPNKRNVAFSSIRGSMEVSSPKQLDGCPACRGKLKWTMKSVASPVLVECTNEKCTMQGALPVLTVDEDIYESPPTLLIGTVDKFALIVREKRTNDLFGVLSGSPPDLVIQDELHLISGPLGTVAGAYEVAFDLMISSHGRKAKIIGSTATIRKAAEQIRSLFDREAFQFPPSAIDHDNSGFAVRDRRKISQGRRYLGVTTAGRSIKFTQQAVAGSLMQTAFAESERSDVQRDAYWTLVGYFNSLRELGGALVLMQDDVADSIDLYANSRQESPRPRLNVEELTSRRTQEEILRMIELLGITADSPGAVDAVLATNMVSVGVDIPRLAMMLVIGQPKTTSEYIQATSRIGRGRVGGLVVSVLNNFKARDRSRFETFCSWHQTLYRDVEATSVTPFASRARDKTLHAVLVASVRHLVNDMLDSPNMSESAEISATEVIEKIVERAERVDPTEKNVKKELKRRLDTWIARSPDVYWSDFKGGNSLLQSAESDASRRVVGGGASSAWPTLNSMRAVEPGSPFRMAPVLKDSEASS